MNKIFKVKRNSAGQSVVTSEIAKSRTKGRVVASALAVAVAGLMASGGASAAELTATNTSGTTTDRNFFADGTTVAPHAQNGSEANNGSNIVLGLDSKTAMAGSNAVIIGTNAVGKSQNVVIGANASTLNGWIAVTTDIGTTAIGYASYSNANISDAVSVNNETDPFVENFNGYTNSSTLMDDIFNGKATPKNQPNWDRSARASTTSVGAYSIAVGRMFPEAGTENFNTISSTSVGSGSISTTGATALGNYAKAKDMSVALGGASIASHKNAVALGSFSITDRDKSVSVGSSTIKRQITNVAAGTKDTDAVNVAQLKDAVARIGGNTTVVAQGDGVSVTKTTSGTTNTYTVALSDATKQSITKAQTDAAKGIADAAAAQTAANTAKADATKALADAKAADDKATAAKTAVDTLKPVVDKNTAEIADLQANKADKADVDAKNAAQDAEIAKKADKTYVDAELAKKADKADLEALKQNITTTIQPALDAKADKADVDAKNAAQDAEIAKKADKSALDATNQTVAANKAAQDAKNSELDAKNAAQDAIIDTKADKTALAATDAKLAALDAVAVTYDDTTKDTITLAGTDGTTITNVKAGAISANSTDAVNGSQLFDVYNYVNQGNDAMRNHINTVEDKLQAGIAGSNASASLPQVRGNGKSMMAFGLGGFQDKGALAIGYSRSSDNGKTVFKAHLNADTEKQFGGGLGLGFEW